MHSNAGLPGRLRSIGEQRVRLQIIIGSTRPTRATDEMVPLPTAVVIPQAAEAFDEVGLSVNSASDISLDIPLDDLARWSVALQGARAEGELSPVAFRIAAAAAAHHIENEPV
jgi:hypothetical protein